MECILKGLLENRAFDVNLNIKLTIFSAISCTKLQPDTKTLVRFTISLLNEIVYDPTFNKFDRKIVTTT